MNIVLPIVMMSVVVGLFVPKRYLRHAYFGMAFWIALIIANYWIKN